MREFEALWEEVLAAEGVEAVEVEPTSDEQSPRASAGADAVSDTIARLHGGR